ncbi:CpaF family protein [Yonghaparkia sp. Root332]|uniref:CpaF family protein n=1 Tax=Yonghaparkia sp. Root332 TaxID=1736516 RepID=UPI0009ECAA16|nr:ATPase, T2SS/T4P/T4SS family [Yonghaparkia sp. Root332]
MHRAPFVPRDPRRPTEGEGPSGPVPIPRELDADLRAILGPLARAVEDDATTDVFVTGDGAVWRDAGAGVHRVPGIRLDATAARELAVRLIEHGGRHIDEATPCADVRIGDGMRVHAALPPIAWAGPALSIRLPRSRPVTLADSGLAPAVVDALRGALSDRRTVLVTGATGSGKTTLLAAWLSEAAPTERIVVIEDVAEARIRHPHVVGLECRQANLEGAGEVDLARLVREALRMRPDRLVVGECRGAEVREFLAALNTGHRGGAGTLHANSLADVPSRLEAVGMIAGLDPLALARQALSGIDLVVHLARALGGARTAELGRFRLDGRERLAIEPLPPEPLSRRQLSDPAGVRA